MVLRVETREEAEKIARADPGVLRGTLEVDIRQWLAVLGERP